MGNSWLLQNVSGVRPPARPSWKSSAPCIFCFGFCSGQPPASKWSGRWRPVPVDIFLAFVLRSLGLKRYGGPPEAVALADAPGADLPPACTGCSGCASPSPAGIGAPSGLQVARVVSEALKAAERPAVPASPSPKAAPVVHTASPKAQLEDAMVEEVLRALAGGR